MVIHNIATGIALGYGVGLGIDMLTQPEVEPEAGSARDCYKIAGSDDCFYTDTVVERRITERIFDLAPPRNIVERGTIVAGECPEEEVPFRPNKPQAIDSIAAARSEETYLCVAGISLHPIE